MLKVDAEIPVSMIGLKTDTQEGQAMVFFDNDQQPIIQITGQADELQRAFRHFDLWLTAAIQDPNHPWYIVQLPKPQPPPPPIQEPIYKGPKPSRAAKIAKQQARRH